MPRDGSGNVTLPAGNPVTAGTLITDEWANTTMEDIRQMLADSFSRSGLGGAQAPVQLADGSEVNPSLTFSNDTSSGMFLFDSGEVWFVVNGERVMRWIEGGVELWDADAMEWVPLETTDAFQGNIETKVISTPGEKVIVFTNEINAAGLFINGPDVDNGALLLGTDYSYDTGTKTVTLTESYPVGTNLTARRILNFNPDEVVVMPIYSNLNAAKAADLPVGTLTRTKGKVTAGDALGAVYYVAPAQAVDEVDDHTMSNGNVLLLQRFDAATVGFTPVSGPATDVQTALFAAEGDIDALMAAGSVTEAEVDALEATSANHETRITNLEGAVGGAFTVFESSELSIAGTGQNSSVAHGLGQRPRFVWAYLRCKIAQHGYSVGDEILLAPGVRNDGEEDGIQTYTNASNIGFVTGGRYPVTIYSAAGEQAQITNANWRVVLRAIV